MKPETAHEYPPKAVRVLFRKFPVLYGDNEVTVYNEVDIMEDGQTYRLTAMMESKIFDWEFPPLIDISDYNYITTWVATEFPKFGFDPSEFNMTVIDPVTECENCQTKIIKHPKNYVKNGFYCESCHNVPLARETHKGLDEFQNTSTE